MGALMPNASRHLSLSPTLCVCVLSHKRLDLLRTTLRSVVNHLEEHEPGLAYELVWVDNGSEQAEAHAMRAEFTFEKALLLGTNYGMAYGFNSLFFRLCSAPYFLTLEEDWEWIGDGQQPPVGQSALRDAIAVLRHDAGVSGVFLRPDTLDQFLTRGPWQGAPRRAAHGAAAGGGGGGLIEYARYCMDRGASYLWGAYSNGPGVYDRERLMRLVGRQYGEPADAFPDPASESNYCYRVGAAGLCSAVLRLWPGCDGVHSCNAPLIRHLGDERSHGYGKGRRPDIRWLVHGSNITHDEHLVKLRSLDVEPTAHWLSLYLSGGAHSVTSDENYDGRIGVLIAARAASMAPIAKMARLLMRAAHAPQRLEFLWMLPAGGAAATKQLLSECERTSDELTAEMGGSSAVLRCVVPPRETTSLDERMGTLAEHTDAQLLLLCPRLMTSIGAAPAVAAQVEATGAALDTNPPAAMAWDRAARTMFGGSGDVREYPKDRVLLGQGPPAGAATPSAHALVHREALVHLGRASPPVGESWLLFALWMQHLFGSVGRHRWIDGLSVIEEDDRDAMAAGGASDLRTRFERSVGPRAIDTHRLDSLLLLLKPKSRTALEGATNAYKRFAELHGAGAFARAWPVLAEVLWSLEAVERSDDWEIRQQVGPAMLPAAIELQEKLVDQFSQAAA